MPAGRETGLIPKLDAHSPTLVRSLWWGEFQGQLPGSPEIWYLVHSIPPLLPQVSQHASPEGWVDLSMGQVLTSALEISEGVRPARTTR